MSPDRRVPGPGVGDGPGVPDGGGVPGGAGVPDCAGVPGDMVGDSIGAVLGEATASLRAIDVTVRFGGVQALSGVSLQAEPGRVTGLIGPNGAGKTTLFNVLTGLQRADRGRVELAGRAVTGWGPHRRARLGLARTFQRLELFWSLSVADNVRVAAESAVRWWEPWRRQRVDDGMVAGLLQRVGLASVADWPTDRLPTGQARLVELARALAMGPSVLLLDEPGSGLSDTEAATLGTVLRRLAAEGMAVVLVEHDMALVMEVCSSVTVLDAGRLLASGTPEEIQCHPAVQAAYLGAAP
jgi:branched-chain amino acid transport system ATP-binding protein